MNREEAFELFDLYEGASNEDILGKYRELYSDYHLRLTNAPTPNLKRIYTQNLQRLEEAFTLLCPDMEIDESQFLPTDKPMQEKIPMPPVSRPENGKSKPTPDPRSRQGENKSFLVVNLIAILGLVAFTIGLFFFILYFKNNTKLKEELKRTEDLQNDTLQLSKLLQPFSKSKQGKLVINNDFNETVEIFYLKVYYIDENDSLVIYKCNPKRKIESKKDSKDFQDPVSGWNGNVLFFSIGFNCIEKPEIRECRSGIWDREQYQKKIFLIER